MPFYPIMLNLFARTILPLLLVTILVAGVTMSVAKAGDVTCTMDMATAMAAPGQDDGDCGKDGGMKPMACAVPCTILASAVLPQTVVPMRQHQALAPASHAQPFLVGRLISPDPHPPRSSISG